MFYKKLNSNLIKFLIKSNMLQAFFWAILSVIYTYSKVVGYVKAYPNITQRIAFTKTISSSAGVNLLTGPAKNINTMQGYMSWVSLMFVLIISISWIIVTVNKIYRGNEQSGRLDILLSGKNDLYSLSNSIYVSIFGLITIYTATFTILVLLICKIPSVNIPLSSGLGFGLAVFITLILFSSIALLSSQLFDNYKSANIFGFIIFAVFYAIKAAADLSNTKWLLYFSPLGWIEKFNPLLSSDYLYLIYLITLTIVIFALCLFILKRREPSTGYLNYHPKRKSHLNTLKNLYLIIYRFNRNTVLIWGISLFILNMLYGVLTNSVIKALNSTSKYTKLIDKFSKSSGSGNVIKSYISAILLISMFLICYYVVYAISQTRKEEQQSRITNILVNPISSKRYLYLKTLFYSIGIYIITISIGLSYYIGMLLSGYHDLSYWSILSASLNIATSGVFILGVGILAYGIIPKLSQIMLSVVLVYSLLIDLISTSFNTPKILNWFSVFTHIRSAPLVNPDWTLNIFIILISVSLIISGVNLFNRRDLISE